MTNAEKKTLGQPDQVYEIVIKTTPEKVWQAITNPEFTKQYWFGSGNVAKEWKKGETWEHVGMENGNVHHLGIIEEIVPNKKLVLSWGNPGDMHDVSRVTFNILQEGENVKLTIVHGDFVPDSAMATRVAGGWPKVISNLKAFLEGGMENMQKSGCGCSDQGCSS